MRQENLSKSFALLHDHMFKLILHSKALAKRRHKLTKLENLGQLATSFGQGLVHLR